MQEYFSDNLTEKEMKEFQINKHDDKIPLIVTLHTIFVALFCDIKSINYALTYGGFVGEGIMAILYPIVVSIIFIVALMRGMLNFKNSYPYALFLILYLLCFYGITTNFIGESYVSIQFFFIFVVCAFLIPQISTVNTKLLIKLIMCFPFFAVFRLNEIFSITNIWLNEISMDASYSFLLPIVANLVYLRFKFKGETKIEKFITLIFSIINGIILGYILLFGSRGPILCILSLLLFWYFCEHTGERGIKIRTKKIFYFVICFMIVLSFGQILISGIVNFLDSYGITITALNKMTSLGDDGDFSNGRSDLYTLAFKGFIDSPIIGNGLDRFGINYPGSSYPHNFILQALYDGGLLLVIVLIFPLLYRLFSFFKRCSFDEYVVFSMLFFASVPGALFSQDLWSNCVLWLSFGLLFTKRIEYTKFYM